MDIATLAAWGEFLGGIAVVVSLIYLASQIRQNSKLLRASTASATSQIQQSFGAMLAQDGELSRIYFMGPVDRSALPESDRGRFDSLMAVFINGQQQQFEFQREGLVLPMSAEYHARSLRWITQQPGTQQWWRDWGMNYGREFGDHVEGLIREAKAAR